MADYNDWANLVAGADDATHIFKGARGSLYVQHADGTTTGFREPSNRAGTGMKAQPRSTKTIYTDKNNAIRLNDFLNHEYSGTTLTPQITNGKLSGVNVIATDDVSYPSYSYKKGQTLAQIPAVMTPQEGLLPLEFSSPKAFTSPIGQQTGKLVHYGNPIKEVTAIPTKLGTAGKIGLAAALASGAGAASAGDLRQAAGNVAESMLPWWMTGGNAGEADESEQVARRYRMAEAGAKAGAGRGNPIYDPRIPTQPVEMPTEYKVGGRVRII
jgi:hypothetical protein